MNPERLKSAAKLANRLSNGEVCVKLVVEEVGVVVRGISHRNDHSSMVDHVVGYDDIEYNRRNPLDHAIARVYDELNDEEILASDWRT